MPAGAGQKAPTRGAKGQRGRGVGGAGRLRGGGSGPGSVEGEAGSRVLGVRRRHGKGRRAAAGIRSCSLTYACRACFVFAGEISKLVCECICIHVRLQCRYVVCSSCFFCFFLCGGLFSSSFNERAFVSDVIWLGIAHAVKLVGLEAKRLVGLELLLCRAIYVAR